MVDAHIARRVGVASTLFFFVLAFVGFQLIKRRSQGFADPKALLIKPFYECEAPIYTRQKRSDPAMAQHLSEDVLDMSSSQRAKFIAQAEDWWSKNHLVRPRRQTLFQLEAASAKANATRGGDQPKRNIILCLGGVIPRGIKYTWRAIERRIVSPLRAHGYQVDIYGLNFAQTKKLDGRSVNLDDALVVPYDYLEEIDPQSAANIIGTRCRINSTCPEWGRADHGMNTHLQLLQENRIGQFLLQPNVFSKYDLAIVWWADFYPMQKVNMQDIERVAQTPFALGCIPHHDGVRDAFYIGELPTISKVLTRWSDVKYISRRFSMYEQTVAAGFSQWGIANAKCAKVDMSYIKVRYYGPRADEWNENLLWPEEDVEGFGDFMKSHTSSDLEERVDRCMSRVRENALSTVRTADIAVHLVPPYPRAGSSVDVPVWAVGSVQVAAIVNNASDFDESRAMGPLWAASAYLRSLPKDTLSGERLSIGDPRAIFLVRWYDSSRCQGCCDKEAACDAFANRAGSMLQWVSSLRVVSVVHLDAAPVVSSSAMAAAPSKYVLPTSEQQRVVRAIEDRRPRLAGATVDCSVAVHTPVDPSPIRSPQAVHSFLTKHLAHKDVVEVGTRKGDGIACFSQVARKATAIEYNEGECVELRRRSESLRAAGNGSFDVLCSDYRKTAMDGDVYTWWQQEPLNDHGLLGHLRHMWDAQQLRKNAEAWVLFDHGWEADMKSLQKLQGLARFRKDLDVDEFLQCNLMLPKNHKYRKICWRAKATFTVLAIPIERVSWHQH